MHFQVLKQFVNTWTYAWASLVICDLKAKPFYFRPSWVSTDFPPLPEAASHVIAQWLPERRIERRSFAAGLSLVHSKTKGPQLGCWPGIWVQLFWVELLPSVTPTSCSLYCCQIMCAHLQFRFRNNREVIKLFGVYCISWYDLGILTSSHP